jgi:uncharacterized protein YbjT (DUF2867 family)
MRKIIVTGASGMVGRGVLLECLDHVQVEKVLSIGRTPLNINHPKFEELIVKNFEDYSQVENQLAGYDAAFFCMGVSAAGLDEAQYSKLTYDYTVTLATTLLKLNSQMSCTYVSGEGTDSTEKGRVMWARVKGKTENALLNLGFKSAFMFRPGAIIPLRGIKSKTNLYQFMYDYFLWFVKLMKVIAPNSVVNTTQVGLAMINSVLFGYAYKVLRPKDIILLSEVK